MKRTYSKELTSTKSFKKAKPAPKQRLALVEDGPELKYHTVAFTNAANTTPVIIPLTTIPQGDTALTRD